MTEPTLSQDVLEAVPAWGKALFDQITELNLTAGLMLHQHLGIIPYLETELKALKERVAELEGTASFHLRWREEIFERVAALEAVVNSPVVFRDGRLEPSAEPEPLPQGDLD